MNRIGTLRLGEKQRKKRKFQLWARGPHAPWNLGAGLIDASELRVLAYVRPEPPVYGTIADPPEQRSWARRALDWLTSASGGGSASPGR